MKEDLKNFQSQNTKTVCSISDLMVVAIITQPPERKYFADIINIKIIIAALTPKKRKLNFTT
tara:strand:+ start:200 stop:385 length:186 start_codon:yes stop_codon:yes gene_type:complete